MEGHISKSDYEKDKEREELFDKVEKLESYHKDSKCCFCETTKGALIRLFQGWCCVKCFKENILEVSGNSSQP